MNTLWTTESAADTIAQFDELGYPVKQELIAFLNSAFPPETYEQHRLKRRKALDNLKSGRMILADAIQSYPETIDAADISASLHNLAGYAIMLTAGGEGERLRISLGKQGYTQEQLKDFTKATFPLPGFHGSLGALQINLCLIAHFCRQSQIDIPVIVSTGPQDSTTARVIPRVLREQGFFGLKNCRVIVQEERLHLTQEEKIAYTIAAGLARPVTNPDETGGPLMKLKQPGPDEEDTALAWLVSLGCKKIILLQATALYMPELILKMASNGKKYDGVGVGIQRAAFPEDDPYGTYVLVEKQGREKLIIAEKEVRNDTTRTLRHPRTGAYLPFNTGFYVFDVDLIRNNDLPDYATPPKEVLPGFPRSPKIGYAATDLMGLARNPAVLVVPEDAFAVIKNAEDLARLTALAKAAGLDAMCRKMNG